MQFYHGHKMLVVIIGCIVLVLGFLLVQFLLITFNGKPVAVPSIPRDTQILGEGPALSYVILGDSTAVGQGGDYATGIAMSSAQLLAKTNTVTFRNVAVSGARVHDVLTKQVEQAIALKPDIVLISISANDVTHLTGLKSVEKDMNAVIDVLRTANTNMQIVITGSPQMGTVPRFPQPTRYIAKIRTAQINDVLMRIARERQLIFAPVAEKTGPIFAKNPQLFAQDKFHPTTEGYNVWLPVINEAILAATKR